MAAAQRSNDKTQTTQKPARASTAPTTATTAAPLSTTGIVQRAQADPTAILPNEILHLQGALGNRAVGALLSGSAPGAPSGGSTSSSKISGSSAASTRSGAPTNTSATPAIQAKLTVGAADDAYEREADHVAAQVLSAPSAAPADPPSAGIARKPYDDSAQRVPLAAAIKPLARSTAPRGYSNKLSRRATDLSGSFEAGAGVEDRIAANASGGNPLPERVRSFMEPRFGADFGAVRLHSGGESAQLNRQLGAKAFTHSNHIYLGEGSSSGDHSLLAHELTHVVQQGAAHSPIRRKTTSLYTLPAGFAPNVQRWPWSKKKTPEANPEPQDQPEPVISAPRIKQPSANPAADQSDAERRISKAFSDILALAAQAKSEGEQLTTESTPDAESLQARKGKSGGTKSAVKRLHRAEAAVHGSVGGTRQGLAVARQAIGQLEDDVIANGKQIKIQLAKDPPDLAGAGPFASDSQKKAANADAKVADAKQQVESMKETSSLEAAMARGKITAKTWPAAESSASDAAVALEQSEHKLTRYHQFIEMDLTTIRKHIADKSEAVSAEYGADVVARILASGRQRGGLASKSGPLSDTQAQALIDMEEGEDREEETEQGADFGAEAEQSMPQQPSPQALTKGNKYLDPSLKEGSGKAFKNMLSNAAGAAGSAIGGGLKSAGKLLSTPFRAIHRAVTRRGGKAAQIAKLRQVQALELMAKFEATGEARFSNAERYTSETIQWYEEALATYDRIDAGKKASEAGGDQKPEGAIMEAGALWTNVAKAASYRETLKQYKLDIIAESGKYEKFGARAIGTGKKVGYALAGAVLGSGLKLLTGGLVRFEKVETGAGYGATLEKKTLVDDVKRAIALCKESANLRGLGGKHGARAFAVLQGIAAFLGIVKTLASTLALYLIWAPPVSAGFAAAGLYATIVKATIDLLLMIWAGIGSKMSMDPRARTRNRGNVARHGLAFGEGAASVGAAGLLAGVSGNAGSFVGHKAGFNTDAPMQHSSKFMNYSVNTGHSELYWGRLGINQGIAQGVPVGGMIGNTIATGVNDQNVRAMKMGDEVTDLKSKSKESKAKMSKGSKKLLDMVSLAETTLSKKNAGKAKAEPGDLEIQGALPGVSQSVESVNVEAQKLPEDVEH